ncbi:hypothetical protein [Pseudomonas sp. UBA6310]|uniref:hypothetical protein n=1 Tax=Pseudomonas sp. UBA6310 TaxID=1947327 RepID=UPI00257BAAB5|nr:hypothetical protein [Pseudomonas sp. UBA6310]
MKVIQPSEIASVDFTQVCQVVVAPAGERELGVHIWGEPPADPNDPCRLIIETRQLLTLSVLDEIAEGLQAAGLAIQVPLA